MRQLLLPSISTSVSRATLDLALLIFRIGIGGSLIHTHGWKKITDFAATAANIPDPFGMGGTTSALIAIIANVVLAGCLMLGFFTRLSALGILSVTLTGLLIVHANDPWVIKDVPYMYSLATAILLILGAGKYSVDNYLYNFFNQTKS